MLLKDYQRRTLEMVTEYLRHLAEFRAKDEKVRAIDAEMGSDFAAKAWEKTAPGRSYTGRKDGIGRPLPVFCLKIPTGGGKTLLATRVVDLVQTYYRQRQTGLVLWVVPTTQIYRQTLQALKDRDHPYRRSLDMASAGRTLILERTSGFSPTDVEGNLCILLLMLPATWRENREQLRMFRDSGGYDRFFPSEEDAKAHENLLEQLPNLDTFGKDKGFWGRLIKTSLGNTLRLLQPLMIIDEGQKAYSPNARAVLESFNPCMMVELSATPPPEANVLVEVLGRDLNREQMIKLDLRIQNRQGVNWKDTLLASIEHRKHLEEEARSYEAETNVYIRPICLIQVERTGKDQRQPGVFVHAEDVRDYLLEHPEIKAEHIAIKTSQKDELKEVDEVGGLLSCDCPIRFIITKQALQEGWDCPFAYVLTILTNPQSKTALTQLVGRILRQPYAHKTGNTWLDESYVFCFQREGRSLLQDIRRGFGLEGLSDLEGRVVEDRDLSAPGAVQEVFVREQFQQAVKDLVLPAFMIREGKASWRLVHYEADILSRIPWSEVTADGLFDLPLSDNGDKNRTYRAGLEEGVLAADPEFSAEKMIDAAPSRPNCAFAASHLLDVVPNPWWGNHQARRVFGKLEEKHGAERVMDNYVFILEELRNELERERDRLAEKIFHDLLGSGEMRFMVVAEDLGERGLRNKLPRKGSIGKNQKRAVRTDNTAFQMSLFDQMAEEDFNDFELKIATYLEHQEPLFFWYRNAARRDFHVQGWRRNRIFADFIFTVSQNNTSEEEAFHKVFVLETKGKHLKGNDDSLYKGNVFTLCNSLVTKRDWSELVPAMHGKTMQFDVVAEDVWEKRLNQLLA